MKEKTNSHGEKLPDESLTGGVHGKHTQTERGKNASVTNLEKLRETDWLDESYKELFEFTCKEILKDIDDYRDRVYDSLFDPLVLKDIKELIKKGIK